MFRDKLTSLLQVSVLTVTTLFSGCVTTTTTTTRATQARSSIPAAKVAARPAATPLATPVAKTAPKSTAAALSPEAIAAATAAATRQVIATERAFAKTMADRDFKSFVTFLSPDAVFFSGSEVKRGPAAVAAAWESYFTGRQAPFSWDPDHVEVLTSGALALSTGPVVQDHKIVGRFNSIWRLDSANTWRIVFDKGEAVCGNTP